MDREEFIQSLFDDADEQLKSVYNSQKKNEAEILNKIAMILLTYTIVDSILKLTNKEKNDNYSRLSGLILNMFGEETKNTTKVTEDILVDVVEKMFKSYEIKSHRDEVLKIIKEHYKGKHFSDRIWDNENDVSKRMHKEIKDFLDGKVNVNQIKKAIEEQFNANKYNIERLVETEIANIESKITEKYFKDYGIKKVSYNATLCRTCDKCLDDHLKVFKVDDSDRPILPRHPKCKCFYVQIDEVNNKSKKVGDSKKIKFKSDTKGTVIDYLYKESKVDWTKNIDISENSTKLLNDVHTELNKFMLDNRREKISILNLHGNKVVKDLEGITDDEITLSKDFIDILKKSKENSLIVTHNHPTSTTFSKYDIQHIIRHGSIKSLTLECIDGTRYYIDRGALKSSMLKDLGFLGKYDKIYSEVAKRYPELNDEIKIYDVWDRFLDNVNEEVSKEYGMIYGKVEY